MPHDAPRPRRLVEPGRLSVTEKAIVSTSRIYEELGLAPSDQDHRRVLAVVSYLSR